MKNRLRTRRGIALIVVLWIGAILTLLVFTFLRSMSVEYSLAAGHAQEIQAEHLAMSGIEKAIALLSREETLEGALTEEWADSKEQFYEVRLGEGFFTLVRPTYEADPVRRYGAIDEASKIHLNTASREMLLAIPGVTEEIADSILDWRDDDEEQRQNGAESMYYQMLETPYSCKNQPFETVEELLYVRGVTPEILFGDDRNQNGVRDAFESQEGEFRPGLYRDVTVWSSEPDVAADGEARVNLNTASDADLRNRLGNALNNSVIQSIQVYRLSNASRGGFASVAHLLDVNGMNQELFRTVVDRCTTAMTSPVVGRINVNTAPRAVLEAIPGMKSEMVAGILEHRVQPGANLADLGWLTEILSNNDLKDVARYLTTRSFQFRLDSMGVVAPAAGAADRPRPFRRIAAVFDASTTPPRLVYWKDWSRFGPSYPLGEESR